MGTWENAKPIQIPAKAVFRVRDFHKSFEVGRSHVVEMRQSQDTGNIYVKIQDEKGRTRYVLLEDIFL
jgi:hypothetical protein